MTNSSYTFRLCKFSKKIRVIFRLVYELTSYNLHQAVYRAKAIKGIQVWIYSEKALFIFSENVKNNDSFFPSIFIQCFVKVKTFFAAR